MDGATTGELPLKTTWIFCVNPSRKLDCIGLHKRLLSYYDEILDSRTIQSHLRQCMRAASIEIYILRNSKGIGMYSTINVWLHPSNAAIELTATAIADLINCFSTAKTMSEMLRSDKQDSFAMY